MDYRIAPGLIRDAILQYLNIMGTAKLRDIETAVSARLGRAASGSSVRSYLNLNTPELFERVERGKYRLSDSASSIDAVPRQLARIGESTLIQADCFSWLRDAAPHSVHAVVTDPPYGLVEYTELEQGKLRNGKGGVWRIPPSFDGHIRSPLPRFTTLSAGDREAMRDFYFELGRLLLRVLVPGANVVVASNTLLAHIVASAMADSGLEVRGAIIRLVMTMRGGDRPKNAHVEFQGISVMPRSMFEPWVVLRTPIQGRVQDNLRKWGTGGFMRPSQDRPFGDVIKSGPTPQSEKRIAPHPSLKPQAFLRTVVGAVLPLGVGTILDPFSGSGSTLAAANAVGLKSVGLERDPNYFAMAVDAVPKLSKLRLKPVDPSVA